MTEYTIHGHRVVPVSPNRYLVRSATDPGQWYETTPPPQSGCDCRGFAFRGTCRHVAAIAAIGHPTCFRCGHADTLDDPVNDGRYPQCSQANRCLQRQSSR